MDYVQRVFQPGERVRHISPIRRAAEAEVTLAPHSILLGPDAKRMLMPELGKAMRLDP